MLGRGLMVLLMGLNIPLTHKPTLAVACAEITMFHQRLLLVVTWTALGTALLQAGQPAPAFHHPLSK